MGDQNGPIQKESKIVEAINNVPLNWNGDNHTLTSAVANEVPKNLREKLQAQEVTNNSVTPGNVGNRANNGQDKGRS